MGILFQEATLYKTGVLFSPEAIYLSHGLATIHNISSISTLTKPSENNMYINERGGDQFAV